MTFYDSAVVSISGGICARTKCHQMIMEVYANADDHAGATNMKFLWVFSGLLLFLLCRLWVLIPVDGSLFQAIGLKWSASWDSLWMSSSS